MVGKSTWIWLLNDALDAQQSMLRRPVANSGGLQALVGTIWLDEQDEAMATHAAVSARRAAR